MLLQSHFNIGTVDELIAALKAIRKRGYTYNADSPDRLEMFISETVELNGQWALSMEYKDGVFSCELKQQQIEEEFGAGK
jgi:hypothetical protein